MNQLRPAFFMYKQKIGINVVSTIILETTSLLKIVDQPVIM